MIIRKKKKQISIRQFSERQDKVLIKRKFGGFGDILMQRMMFEDFSKSGIKVFYSCPHQFIEMAQSHPFLSEEPIEISKIDDEDFGIVYDISSICKQTESREGSNNKKHRSDIWANHCGIELQKHEMHLSVDPESLQFCKNILSSINEDNNPVVLLCTKSTNDDFGEAKSLTNNQISKVVEHVKSLGMLPVTTGDSKQEIYEALGVKQFTPINIKTWIALVQACDLIVSVDTATFHIAGGLKKPLVGIFSFTNGKVYGKYYDFVLVQKHRDNGDWDCGPCYVMTHCVKDQINKKKPCITELSDLEIKNGISSAIKNWNIN